MKQQPGINKQYIIIVSLLTLVFPLIFSITEILLIKETSFSFSLAGKWFIFFAVGLRLCIAGIKQVADPAFTAKEIFHIDNTESFVIIRELGFANICFGLIGIVSLFVPQWKVVSAFGSGLYYGIAGAQHLIRRPVGINERFALFTDLFIFIFLAFYCVQMM